MSAYNILFILKMTISWFLTRLYEPKFTAQPTLASNKFSLSQRYSSHLSSTVYENSLWASGVGKCRGMFLLVWSVLVCTLLPSTTGLNTIVVFKVKRTISRLFPSLIPKWYLLIYGCFVFLGPLRQNFSLYQAFSQRGRNKREKVDERKNVQTTPPEPTASAISPCP